MLPTNVPIMLPELIWRQMRGLARPFRTTGVRASREYCSKDQSRGDTGDRPAVSSQRRRKEDGRARSGAASTADAVKPTESGRSRRRDAMFGVAYRLGPGNGKLVRKVDGKVAGSNAEETKREHRGGRRQRIRRVVDCCSSAGSAGWWFTS